MHVCVRAHMCAYVSVSLSESVPGWPSASLLSGIASTGVMCNNIDSVIIVSQRSIIVM